MSSKSSGAVVATEGFILWVYCSVGESSCFGGYFDRVTFRPAFSIFAFTDGITLVSFAFRLWAIVCTWRWFVCRLECKKKSLSICILVVYSLSLHWQGERASVSLFSAPLPWKDNSAQRALQKGLFRLLTRAEWHAKCGSFASSFGPDENRMPIFRFSRNIFCTYPFKSFQMSCRVFSCFE